MSDFDGSLFELIWLCACGWQGKADELKNNPSGIKVCPDCGGSGGLISQPVDADNKSAGKQIRDFRGY